MISVEDLALIRRLVADGVPQRQAARQLGIGRSTVERALASDRPPKYERLPRETSFTPFEARVRALLAEHPEMPATVIAERVEWSGSITWFRQNVRRLRPEDRPIGPADQLSWTAGNAAQCDLWFPPRKTLLEDGSIVLLPVLVIVAAHSRFVTARMIPTRKTEELLRGSWELIQQLGRVPRCLIWDNEPGIGQKGQLALGVAAFAGTLATNVVQLRPYDPESKGIVERRNGWFETSFMPSRTFNSPADFNAQLADLLEKANIRVVHDRSRMLPLPRSRCSSAGKSGSAWVGTTMSASTRPTTPSTRKPSADSSTSAQTWTASGFAWRGGSSPTTPGSGRAGARSPTRRMSRPRDGCSSSSRRPDQPP